MRRRADGLPRGCRPALRVLCVLNRLEPDSSRRLITNRKRESYPRLLQPIEPGALPTDPRGRVTATRYQRGIRECVSAELDIPQQTAVIADGVEVSSLLPARRDGRRASV